jgi:hypothetical protein
VGQVSRLNPAASGVDIFEECVMFTVEEARALLTAAKVFYDPDPDEAYDDRAENEGVGWGQTLNLNDTFAWACADGEPVSDADLPRVAQLFYRYGWCGILYWVTREKRTGGDNPNWMAEFLDVRRFIEFVEHEEQLRRDELSDSKRAYRRLAYTLGEV